MQLWTQLLTDVVKDGVTGNRVIVDILNEPDAAKFRWDLLELGSALMRLLKRHFLGCIRLLCSISLVTCDFACVNAWQLS